MPSAQFSDFLKKTLSRNEIDPLHQKIFNENLTAAAKKLPNVLDGEDYVSINTVREDDETQLSTITLVATDRPFLIDSFSAIVHAAGLRMKNLFHQSFFMNKEGKNKLSFAKSAKSSGIECDIIYAELSTVCLPKQEKSLKKTLETMLLDVRLATKDWQPMLEKLRAIKDEIRHIPASQAQYPLHEYEDFLQYLHDDSFTFLGYRQYAVEHKGKETKLTLKRDKGLGILSADRKPAFLGNDADMFSKDMRPFLKRTDLITISKIQKRSLVHRSVPIDVIAIKRTDHKGVVKKIDLFLGLFTSITYSRSIFTIPLVSNKINNIINSTNFKERTHNYRALVHILEKYPRDEVFQMDEETLASFAQKLLALQECQRIAMFPRIDVFERYISALVYVPRSVYDTRLRIIFSKILEESFDGTTSAFYTNMDDSMLVRVLFTITSDKGVDRKFNFDAIERRLINEGQDWSEKLATMLRSKYSDPAKAHELIERYSHAFPASYKELYEDYQATHDVRYLERILNKDGNDIELDLYESCTRGQSTECLRLKIYHKGKPITLSDILPIIGHMGLRVIAESPHSIKPAGEKSDIWIHDLSLESKDQSGAKIDVAEIKENFEETLLKLWHKEMEDDALNSLVTLANLSWRDVYLLRAYMKYMKQIRYQHGQAVIIKALNTHADIARNLTRLFEARFNPALKEDREKTTKKFVTAIKKQLEKVKRLEFDHVFRSMIDLIMNTVRTNFYQKGDADGLKPYISFKIKSKQIEEIPAPRPWAEIFVYSPGFEGVHLRGGPIARGGLRWSDRLDDFRTEVLGLMKAQMVKNGVIVPVGSKGGFVIKDMPEGISRDEFMERGIKAYKLFIGGLLDITDNLNKSKKIVPPKDVIRHDGDDAYLVVAADKGTASFSDIANGVARDYGFWLDDAFASGGSAGYDHKKMGITARGGWEAVKRHFREMGTNIQKEEFDVIGCGDMGGDVFGNGMLLSKHIRLIGAFNHLHIFCDPNPDAAKSFKERQRLFDNVLGWDQYDEKLLSKGGRIFNRNDKELTLTPEIQSRFGIEEKKISPFQLIHKMLKAETDLLWFGGIGTYIKSKSESHIDVSDKANDMLRVNASDVKAKVIGEGANLGVTQQGRIDFALSGGRINTDFIDNSAGVNSSDQEVNIKILLSHLFDPTNKTQETKRNKLLESMTEDVAEAVLTNNYQQTQALSLMGMNARDEFSYYMRLITQFEHRLDMDRALESLPTLEEAEIRYDTGESFTRPELATILCYAKIMFYNDLLASDVPDMDSAEGWLMDYFPEKLQKKYDDEIKEHSLRREIIATQITNSVVNRVGPSFIYRCAERTGAKAEDVVRAYLFVRQMLSLPSMWKEIEDLDNKLPASVQLKCFNEILHLVEHCMIWFLSRPALLKKEKVLTGDFCKHFDALIKLLPGILPDELTQKYDGRLAENKADGLTQSLAHRIALCQNLVSCLDIIKLCLDSNLSIKEAAELYYGLGDVLSIVWLRNQARGLQSDNSWDKEAIRGLIDQLFDSQSQIALHAIALKKESKDKTSVLNVWLDKKKNEVKAYSHLIDDLKSNSHTTLSMLTTAEQRVRSLFD